MSEFSFSSNTSKKTKFSSLLLADFFNVCFFILSHPLYFSYFIFFSPYLLKLLSFLSPLFITTALLVLAYLTVSPPLVQDNVANSELSSIKVGCLVTTYQTVLERLQKSKTDDGAGDDHDHEEFRSFEELEVYKIVFDTSSFEIGENPVEEICSQVSEAPVDDVSSHEGNAISAPLEAASDVLDENPAEVIAWPRVETLAAFFQEENWSKDFKEEKEVKPASTLSNKVDEDGKEKRSMRRASKDLGSKTSFCEVNADYDGDQFTSKSMSNSQRLGANFGEDNIKVMEDSQMLMGPNLGSFGSMRKEKEWRRTLACKLFEERHHNVEGGGEGMDMLWETYDETESIKAMKGKGKSKKGKNGKVEEEDDGEEEEEFDGQLCCLQALKFSAGKMNLGMGRPNLVKFSKALKGFGWLHHVTKHGKKGYH
ncbi:unnamed protein product [Prunus armeniaca]|uniref:Uncharacterized protein n=1 Tax=Prunus armeniaca TaxID=36596 RepID=A0A6J5Y5Y3_PRUAR|nr:unnamed protein product [Prunus armeniaca]CAB4321530.1 unnamed protein product [Prunus armeniaca]